MTHNFLYYFDLFLLAMMIFVGIPALKAALRASYRRANDCSGSCKDCQGKACQASAQIQNLRIAKQEISHKMP